MQVIMIQMVQQEVLEVVLEERVVQDQAEQETLLQLVLHKEIMELQVLQINLLLQMVAVVVEQVE